MSSYYPVFLDLKKRRCVIIGGGSEAEKKVPYLLKCEAIITVISSKTTHKIKDWINQGAVSWKARDFSQGDLSEVFLAIDTSDEPSINQVVVREAAEERVLLNVVDVTPLCTFIAPAIVNRGDVTVAISTSGTSPALARKLRESLESSDILDYANLSQFLSKARKTVKELAMSVNPDQWQKYINETLLSLVANGHEQEAIEYLLNGLSEGTPPIEVNK